jgi:hypothetical protein
LALIVFAESVWNQCGRRGVDGKRRRKRVEGYKMKLSIAQVVLGVLIVLAACYIVGWMIFGVPRLLNMSIPDESGVISYIDAIPEHEVLFTAARSIAWLVFILGLVVLMVGVVQTIRSEERNKKLAKTQIIAGILIVVASFFVSTWGYPNSFILPTPEGSDMLKRVYINPGPEIIRVRGLTILNSILGLAVLGVGIAQLVKAGKMRNNGIKLEEDSLPRRNEV